MVELDMLYSMSLRLTSLFTETSPSDTIKCRGRLENTNTKVKLAYHVRSLHASPANNNDYINMANRGNLRILSGQSNKTFNSSLFNSY